MSSYCFRNANVYTGYLHQENCCLWVEDGKVVDVFNEARFAQKKFSQGTIFFDLKEAKLAPGFIDTHIHGFKGYGVEDCSSEAVLRMSETLVEYGVTSFFPTIYPQPLEKMLSIIEACATAMGQEKGARILGLHLEGPFISPKRLGVQIASNLQEPSIEIMKRLIQAAQGKIRNMTVAPELKGMHELALFCQNCDIVLQAGHTDASYSSMKEGVQVGITHSTHFFNAMSPLHHRDPNAVGAVLINRELTTEIIADGLHVHPDLVKMLMRDKPFENIVLVTDALKPTEQVSGDLVANGELVYLDKTGLFRRKQDDVIAGSSLTMIRGVENLVKFGAPLEEALRMSSTNPARIMKLRNKGSLLPGNDADIVIFDDSYRIQATMVGGEFKFNELTEL